MYDGFCFCHDRLPPRAFCTHSYLGRFSPRHVNDQLCSKSGVISLQSGIENAKKGATQQTLKKKNTHTHTHTDRMLSSTPAVTHTSPTTAVPTTCIVGKVVIMVENGRGVVVSIYIWMANCAFFGLCLYEVGFRNPPASPTTRDSSK